MGRTARRPSVRPVAAALAAAGLTAIAGCAARRAVDRDARPPATVPTTAPDALDPPAVPGIPSIGPASASPLAHGSRRGRQAVAHMLAMVAAGSLPPHARRDCSGFVGAGFEAAGRPLVVPPEHRTQPTVSGMLLAWARATRRVVDRLAPAVGDLAFFRDTSGEITGRITHVAIVETVEPDGQVRLLHWMGGAVRRDPMDLRNPSDAARNGPFRRRERSGEPTLAGELFVAFARFD